MFDVYLPEPHASLLNGIIFGVKLKTATAFYQQIKMVGLLHLVVLSGSNITILIAIVGSLTQFLGKLVSIVLSILTIILFIIFVGPQAPVVRAGFMGILTLVAVIYGRKTYALYSLLLSLIFTAIFWPGWINTLSLQLSYAATLGMILFARKSVSQHHRTKNTLIDNFFKGVKDELRTSLSAQALTVPLIYIYFKEISLVAPLANLLVSFLIAPLMIFGLLTYGLGKLHYWLALVPSYLCFGMLDYLVCVIKVLSQLPGAYIKLHP